MKRKYLAVMLTGIIMAAAVMGCKGNKPADSEKVTTEGTTTVEEETTTVVDDSTKEEETKASEEESTEEKEEETTTAAAEDETTEKQTERPTQKPTEKPTVKPTEAPTAKPTVAPTKPVVKPTEPPTAKPTVAPTQAPTQKPTQAPTTKPTQPPTQKPTEPPTTLAPVLYIKEIDGIPYTVDGSKNKAYIEEFAITLAVLDGKVFPDTIHLPYEVDGYVVDYFCVVSPLGDLTVKNLYVDERVEKLFSFLDATVNITDNLYWYNTDIENWNPGREHNIWLDSIGKYCTLHLGVKSTDLIFAQGTGFVPGSPTYYKSVKEVCENSDTAGIHGLAYQTFVCTDGTYSLKK